MGSVRAPTVARGYGKGFAVGGRVGFKKGGVCVPLQSCSRGDFEGEFLGIWEMGSRVNLCFEICSLQKSVSSCLWKGENLSQMFI